MDCFGAGLVDTGGNCCDGGEEDDCDESGREDSWKYATVADDFESDWMDEADGDEGDAKSDDGENKSRCGSATAADADDDDDDADDKTGCAPVNSCRSIDARKCAPGSCSCRHSDSMNATRVTAFWCSNAREASVLPFAVDLLAAVFLAPTRRPAA